MVKATVDYSTSLITDDDTFLFNEGSHFRLYEKLEAYPLQHGGAAETFFSVWAPEAENVSVMGVCFRLSHGSVCWSCCFQRWGHPYPRGISMPAPVFRAAS